MGGELEVIVETEVGSTYYADTVRIRVQVPGLIHPDSTSANEWVYYIGGRTEHVQASNWYQQATVANRMESIAEQMFISPFFYLQHNDASLKWGGTLTIEASSTGVGIDPLAPLGHRGHALGTDVDIGWCYAEAVGDDNQANRVFGTNCSSTEYVSFDLLFGLADSYSGCMRAHGGNHFHIRFAGRCEDE